MHAAYAKVFFPSPFLAWQASLAAWWVKRAYLSFCSCRRRRRLLLLLPCQSCLQPSFLPSLLNLLSRFHAVAATDLKPPINILVIISLLLDDVVHVTRCLCISVIFPVCFAPLSHRFSPPLSVSCRLVVQFLSLGSLAF